MPCNASPGYIQRTTTVKPETRQTFSCPSKMQTKNSRGHAEKQTTSSPYRPKSISLEQPTPRKHDRFEDHYLTIYQVGGHVAIQLCFSAGGARNRLCLPQRGVLIFGFGALRMTSRQAIIAWTLTMIGLAPIFLFTSTPIGLPIATPDRTRRRHAFLCPHDRTMRLRRTVWQRDAQDALRPQLRTERQPTSGSRNLPNSTN